MSEAGGRKIKVYEVVLSNDGCITINNMKKEGALPTNQEKPAYSIENRDPGSVWMGIRL